MRIWARRNHIGFIHLWMRRDSYDEGQASDHFFNGRSDPRWADLDLDQSLREALERGELVEIEDPGYFLEFEE